MAAHSELSDPDKLEKIADLFAQGLSREAMLDACEVEGIEVKTVKTITRWRRDPRVKAIVEKKIADRAIQVSRKIDAIIVGRLDNAENIPLKDLVLLRKEFGGATLGQTKVGDDAEVTAGAAAALEKNPELLEQLLELVGANGA